MVTLDELERRFNEMEIPETPIAIVGGVINNPKLFIQTHIRILEETQRTKHIDLTMTGFYTF